MKIIALTSCTDDDVARQYAVTYVVNDCIAIDAGCLGVALPMHRQKQIRHVILSHSHADHTASLPLFLDNVYEPGPECVSIHASAATWEALRGDVFNERTWPALERIAASESPFFQPHPLEPESAIELAGLRIEPVLLDHAVPTVGFILEDFEGNQVAIVSDTGPTERIWERLRERSNVRAVLLDVSFPERLRWLANKSRHLCPSLAANEMRKCPRVQAWYAIHLKPAFFEEIRREVEQLNCGLCCLEVGREYTF